MSLLSLRREIKVFLHEELPTLRTRLVDVENRFDVVVDTPPAPKGTVEVVLTAPRVSRVDEKLDLRIEVRGSGDVPTGSISLYDNDRAITGTEKVLFNGAASGTITYHRSGLHRLSARYSGDSYYPPQPKSNVIDLEVQ